MKRNKAQKGIAKMTILIAIIASIILALVMIFVLKDENTSTTEYNEAQSDTMQEKTKNSITYDKYGNKIVIPAGFKIRVDETTNNANDVTKGIVIEDANGNQFVWVPVGEIKTENGTKTITLGRYGDYGLNTDGEYTPVQPTSENPYTLGVPLDTYMDEYYVEEQPTGNGQYENAIARNINDFITSAIQNGGYYIGRYEAGKTSDNKLVCQAGQQVYNYVTQKQASELAKGMYENGYGKGLYSSDLINSYAWDTAIIFIQMFGIDAGKYSIENYSKNFTTTGASKDEQCNINDMASNANEWTTETCYENGKPCVFRGGYYYEDYGDALDFTRARSGHEASYSYKDSSFRIILYVAI